MRLMIRARAEARAVDHSNRPREMTVSFFRGISPAVPPQLAAHNVAGWEKAGYPIVK
jgi:hypothetical protein